MKILQPKLLPLYLGMLTLCAAGNAPAAVIEQTVDNQSWLNAVWGSPAAAPTTANDYVTALVGTNLVRTSPAGGVAGGDADFTGNSLTVVTGTRLLMKQENGQTAAINGGGGDLVMSGGRLSGAPNSGSNNITLDVHQLVISSNSHIDLAASAATLTIDGTLTGPGDLLIDYESGSNADGRAVSFASVSGYTGAIVVNDGVDIDFGADCTFSKSMTLGSGSVLHVDQTLTFGGGLFDGVNGAVAEGVYSGAALAALGANYTDGGGTLVVSEAPGVPDAGTIHVYLLGGQSNMQGVGRISKLPAELREIPEILLYHSNDVSSTGPANSWISLRGAGFANGYFGPEIGFGDVMRDLHPGQAVALIKHANGGSNLEVDWKPGADNADTGNQGPQYIKFVSTVNAGINALIALGYEPEIRGMLWQQGEEDAKNGLNSNTSNTSADDYAVNLSHFIARIREQFAGHASPGGIRFVLGQVLPYAPEGGHVRTTYPARDLVRQHQLDVDEGSGSASSVSNTAAVPTDYTTHPSHENELDGFRDTDETHINAEAQLALGRSMAYKMDKLAPLGFEDWKTIHGIGGGPDDDSDHDGLCNLLEYYLNSSPTSSGSANSPTVSWEMVDEEMRFVFTHTRNLNAIDASATAQVSEDLIHWNQDALPVFVESVHNGDGTATVKYWSPWEPGDDAHPRVFLRLSIHAD
jgi:hypothetical protein